MASPELYRGICSICYGTLFQSNALSWDLGDGRGGVHRGVCAIHAGFYPAEHAARFEQILADYHAAMDKQPHSSEAHALLMRYYEMASEVADEDHDADHVERRFEQLKQKWDSETSHMSTIHDMCVENPTYNEIIAMGWDVVPEIINDLRRKPDHWFWALVQITGVDAAAGTSTVDGAAQAWVKWWDNRDWQQIAAVGHQEGDDK